MPHEAQKRADPVKPTWARRILTAAIVSASLAAGPAAAACRNDPGAFGSWLAAFKQEAAQNGISRRTIASALDGVRYDPGIIQRDRRQSVFAQGFVEFSGRMIKAYRLKRGRSLIRRHDAIFDRIRQQYGVPAPVITAFWGLETDFGAVLGDERTLRSLATLAFDCRRPELFRRQLHAALQIIERGDLKPSQMIGAWAGEIGQFQFMPEHYVSEAVDFDGDGRRDLIKSTPDALASAANHIRAIGWRAGEPWIQEVRVPERFPWKEADLAIKKPRSEWIRLGVRGADGKQLRNDSLPAALVLPMGRNGPAFLAYPNFFNVYLEWNKSLTYTLTAAYFATRLDGASPFDPGSAKGTALSLNQVKEVQRILRGMGHDVGKVDGIVGAGTRAAVKAVQVRMGVPADSYPTSAFLARLRKMN